MKKQHLFKIINFMDNLKNKNEEYQNYTNSINSLASKLLDYYTPDNYGKYKIMTKEEYDKLDSLYKDAIEKSGYYLQNGFEGEENQEEKETKKAMNEKIHKDLLSDYEYFKNVKLDESKSFYEEMEELRHSEAGNISASNITIDGLFEKDELTVDYANEKVSGTFIYKTEYDADKIIDNLIKEFSAAYPQYKDYFSTLNDLESLNELSNIKNEEMITNGSVINFLNRPLKASEAPNFNEYKNQMEFLNANAQFIMKLRPVLKDINAYSLDLNLQKGTNLDRRNVALYKLADLLNHDEVIPVSKAVAIEKDINGKKVYTEGTFIEKTAGKTIDEFGIKDEIRNSNLDKWDTIEAKKDLANLQILDYISGNKRDINNLKFEFDPNTKELISVKGVNNEKSFVNDKAIENEALDEEIDYSDITNLKVIDEDMAKRIIALDEASLKVTLANNGLSDKEVESALNRLNKLKDFVKEAKTIDEKDNVEKALKDEKFVIVSNEAWKNLKFDNLVNGNNLFSKTVEAHKKLTGPQIVDKSLDEKYKILKFAYNNKLYHGDNFLSEAKKNAPLFGTSRRYSNVIKKLNDYNSSVTVEEKEAKLAKLKDALDIYNAEKVRDKVLDEKGNLIKNLTGKDLARVNLVKDISNFVSTVEKLKNEVDDAKLERDENEFKVDEINSTFRKGKYANYAKLYKDDEGKILINSNIIEREKQNNNSLKNATSNMIKINNGIDLEKNPDKKRQYEDMTKYISTSIENFKKQLKIDYEHGVIPKEYYEYKIDRYNKKIFSVADDEKLFKAEAPNSEIFKNDFQDNLLKAVEPELDNNLNINNIINNNLENEEALDKDEEEIDNNEKASVTIPVKNYKPEESLDESVLELDMSMTK